MYFIPHIDKNRFTLFLPCNLISFSTFTRYASIEYFDIFNGNRHAGQRTAESLSNFLESLLTQKSLRVTFETSQHRLPQYCYILCIKCTVILDQQFLPRKWHDGLLPFVLHPYFFYQFHCHYWAKQDLKILLLQGTVACNRYCLYSPSCRILLCSFVVVFGFMLHGFYAICGLFVHAQSLAGGNLEYSLLKSQLIVLCVAEGGWTKEEMLFALWFGWNWFYLAVFYIWFDIIDNSGKRVTF